LKNGERWYKTVRTTDIKLYKTETKLKQNSFETVLFGIVSFIFQYNVQSV